MVCKILVSSLGDTDPVRGGYDGAMLHIVRHYHPDRVFLIYTEEMEKRDARDDRYVRALRALAPQCVVKKIFTGIYDAHFYDSFLHILPQQVYAIASEYPEVELLLNLSSGTPQIKTIMAFLAIDIPKARGIQVVSPERGSNHKNFAQQDDESTEDVLDNNLDNLPESENRCEEPALNTIRIYGLRKQIISLCRNYEYGAANQLYQLNSTFFPVVTGELLKHAFYRSNMMTRKARQCLEEYNGNKLFKVNGAMERISEFFLIIVLRQIKGQIPEMLVKMTPFLFTLSKEYIKKTRLVPLQSYISVRGNGVEYLVAEKIQSKNLELYNYINEKYKNMKTGPLSFTNLLDILNFYMIGIKKEDVEYTLIVEKFNELREIEAKYRNIAAHEIWDLNEETFKNDCGYSTKNIVNIMQRLLGQIYGPQINKMINIYDEINDYVEESMKL